MFHDNATYFESFKCEWTNKEGEGRGGDLWLVCQMNKNFLIILKERYFQNGTQPVSLDPFGVHIRYLHYNSYP